MAVDLHEYTDSLIEFLEEKEKEYTTRGLIPTITELIQELKEARHL